MRSWQSVFFEKILYMRGTKRRFTNVSKMERYIDKRKDAPPFQLNQKFLTKHQIIEKRINNMRYYIVNEQVHPTKIIYYFHGGAYINDPLRVHWSYILKLAKETGFMIIVPIYPKLPHHTFAQCYDALHVLYDKIVEEYDVPFIFMGDSSGGGIALGFAQDVKSSRKKQCEQVVLLSPWVDLDANDPFYYELEKRDPTVGIVGGQKIAALWRSAEHPRHYRVSPIYGELKNIGRIIVFVGTYELLLLDARNLLKRAIAEGADIIYFEYPKMNHVFPVFPIPEASHALKTLVSLLKKYTIPE